MRFLRWLAGLLAPPRPPAPRPYPATADADCADTVARINAARKANGQAPLLPVASLAAMATAEARRQWTMGDIAIAHRPDLPGRFAAAGYRGSAEGECLAQGLESAAAVVALWLGDPPHRAILLGNYQHIGVGRFGAFWVAELGRP